MRIPHLRRTIIATAAVAMLAGAPLAFPERVMRHHEGPTPLEPGQGAFAAIAEIVALMEANPDTDWSRVDIAALREHLVDMNTLVLNATAHEKQISGGLEIEVQATGRAHEAVQRMVPAHAIELDRRTGLSATARVTPGGAVLRVTAFDPAGESKIRALGFFGLMALDQHHQAHHWAIARGTGPHHH